MQGLLQQRRASLTLKQQLNPAEGGVERLPGKARRRDMPRHVEEEQRRQTASPPRQRPGSDPIQMVRVNEADNISLPKALRGPRSGQLLFQGLLLAALFSFLLVPNGPLRAEETCASGQQKQIHIGQQTFAVSLADTEPKRLRGLSGRRELTAGSGMWFVFPSPSHYGFWMQEMNFPIDLIWVGANRKVLGAVTLQPCQTQPCPTTLPPAPVTHVLEINAGEFAGKVGDAVSWSCVKPSRK